MKKMLIGVFLFLALVIGVVVFIIMLYIPKEESIRWSESGIVLSESGIADSCTIDLGGTLKSYRMDTRLPYFSSSPYSTQEGLGIDGVQYVSNISFNWQEGKDIIRFCRNGITIFTDRAFSFVVAIVPVSRSEDVACVAPAKNVQQGLEVLEKLVSDPNMQKSWKSEYTYLQSVIEPFK